MKDCKALDSSRAVLGLILVATQCAVRAVLCSSGRAMGPRVAFTPGRALSGIVAGSPQMGVSEAAEQWPRGGNKTQ